MTTKLSHISSNLKSIIKLLFENHCYFVKEIEQLTILIVVREMPGHCDASGKLRNKSRLFELKVRVIILKSCLYIDDQGFPFYFINRQNIDSETDL